MIDLNNPDGLASRILEDITNISAIKRNNGLMPDYATFDEIFNAFKVEIKDILRELCHTKHLEWHKTINGVLMFGITDKH